MRADMEKFGLDAFKFEIIEECTVEELKKKETYYIETLKPEYNIKKDGYTLSEVARKRISKSTTGKKKPTISCKVKCVETGEFFDSIRAAAQWCKVPKSTVNAVLAGRGKTAGGFHWIYADKNKNADKKTCNVPKGQKHTPEQCEKIRQGNIGKKRSKETCSRISKGHTGIVNSRESYIQVGKKISKILVGNSRASKKIICLETAEIFESGRHAANHFNIDPSKISAALHGRLENAGGYHWIYYTENFSKEFCETLLRNLPDCKRISDDKRTVLKEVHRGKKHTDESKKKLERVGKL